jgi:hypothetical protein
MKAICPICEIGFKDGEDIVAVMLSTYKQIESSTSFAIDHPTRCLEIVHSGCYDWDDHEFEEGDN